MSVASTFIPGVYSQVGRQTEEELGFLRRYCEVEPGPEVQEQTANSGEALPKSPSKGGQVRRRLKACGGSNAKRHEPGLPCSTDASPAALAIAEVWEPPQRVQASFASRGMHDGAWTSKFTAAHSPGALNRWEEQRPDPGWYKVQYGLVHERQPTCDFRERPRHVPLVPVGGVVDTLVSPSAAPIAGGNVSPAALRDAFLTAVDSSEDMDGSPKTVHELAAQGAAAPSRHGAAALEQMALTSPRGDLGRVGRVHVLMHEVSHPSEDLLQQDLKAFPKNTRSPEWDFAKAKGRSPLMCTDSSSTPGKYDVSLGCVKPLPKGGVQFAHALSRSASAAALGHGAMPAMLHPEEKRSPGGCVHDRSKAKDTVRHRTLHVNNFNRELERPEPGREQLYHNTCDPAACEAVLQRDLSFDANMADRWVTCRRDIAPGYTRMLPRGRDAVQGLRALQHDLGVRGSVGLAFTETSGQREQSVARRECRRADGARERPDAGPLFDHYTLFQPTVVQNNFIHGSPLVRGSGPFYDAKQSPLRKPIKRYERKAPPGFVGNARHGSTRMSRRSRTYEALPGWSADVVVEEQPA
mmetsp:Transcript_33535/g.106356  ORF Transcript_33535/g.106356 Transcript_33535/m.106356 type:complete len:580 (+) Transcript_33535:106-1845(+)